MNDVHVLVAPRPRERLYYGWVVLAIAALAMVGTLPGRSQGLGLITEPLIRDLGLSRVTFAQINLIATLIGALFCLGVGRVMDAVGSRLVLTVTAIALGLTVLAMSQATGSAAMLAAVTLTRGLGQSALSVISLAMVGKWFRRRLTTAMAVYALVMSVGFMLAFPLVGALVQSLGWRAAWSLVGASLLIGLAPVAWWLDRSSPEMIGLAVDGDGGAAAPEAGEHETVHATIGEALRSPAFWVFALASSVYGLVASGIGLLNESILAERGFAPDVYYTALAVTAVTGLAGNFAAGALASRLSFRVILVAALAVLAAGLTGLAHVATQAQVMAQAVAMGIAGGFITVVFFSFWGRAYGRRHLGRIQGAAQAMTVVASALGPLFLAEWVDRTGSYSTAFYVLAAIVTALAMASCIVAIPPGAAKETTRAKDADVPALTLLQEIDAGSAPTIIDVRSRAEFMRGHVPGALHLPFATIHQHLEEIPGSRHDPIVVYCGHGPRAWLARAVLRRHGFSDIRYLSGHFSHWTASRLREQTD